MNDTSEEQAVGQTDSIEINQSEAGLEQSLAFIKNEKLRSWIQWCTAKRVENLGEVVTPIQLIEMVLEGVAKENSGPLKEPSEYAAMIREIEKRRSATERATTQSRTRS